eukprot:289014-Alexandrium_andersonii.AAC.1
MEMRLELAVRNAEWRLANELIFKLVARGSTSKAVGDAKVAVAVECQKVDQRLAAWRGRTTARRCAPACQSSRERTLAWRRSCGRLPTA